MDVLPGDRLTDELGLCYEKGGLAREDARSCVTAEREKRGKQGDL